MRAARPQTTPKNAHHARDESTIGKTGALGSKTCKYTHPPSVCRCCLLLDKIVFFWLRFPHHFGSGTSLQHRCESHPVVRFFLWFATSCSVVSPACLPSLHLNSHPSIRRIVGARSSRARSSAASVREAARTAYTLKATVLCSNNSIHHRAHRHTPATLYVCSVHGEGEGEIISP